MATIQDLEQPIHEAIAHALVIATPEHWHSAELDVERIIYPDGHEGLRHEIFSPDGHLDIVQPTDDVYDATRELADIYVSIGKPWRKITFVVRLKDDDKWSYRVDYCY